MQGFVAIAVGIGIGAEATVLYTNAMNAKIAAEAANNAAELKKAEADKAAADAKVAVLNAALTEAQTATAVAQAKLTVLNQALVTAQTAKTTAEAAKAEIDTQKAKTDLKLLNQMSQDPEGFATDAAREGMSRYAPELGH